MHYCDCKGTMTLQLLQRVFQRMLTINFAADRVNHQPSERISSELVNGYRRNTQQPPQILLDMDSLLGLVKFLLMKEGKTD